MRAVVPVQERRRVVVSRARRSPEVAIYVLTVVLVVAMLVHRHHGPGGPDYNLVHRVTEEAAMMAVMMMPLAGSSARLVAQRSLRSRWMRSVCEHVAGFASVWFAYGLVAALAVQLLRDSLGSTVVLVELLTGAAVWQLSSVRRRRAERCARLRTAAPSGWRADVGSALAGGGQAGRCVTTCWASMLAMVAAPHPLVMGTVAAANLSEWARGPDPAGPARRRRPAAIYLALALGTLLVTAARTSAGGS